MNRNSSGRSWLALGMVLAFATVCRAQMSELPKPTKEHELLKQFAGEWDVTSEAQFSPGAEPIKCTGTESAKMVGGFWLIGRGEASIEGLPMLSVLTIGFDPAKKKYVGTFLCSADSRMWKYEGSMDDSGTKLTLETEGPSPVDQSKIVKYRDVLELKDKDHKVFTSYMQSDDGEWTTFMTLEYERKE